MFGQDLPKLLPLWNGVSIRDVQDHGTLKDGKVTIHNAWLDNYLYPDHGGAGIDMKWDGSAIQCEELKLSNAAYYVSNACAMPFLPPIKVKFKRDPCLGSIHQRRKKEQKFVRSLQACRNRMNARGRFRKTVFSCLDELPDLIKKGKFDDIFVPKSVIKLARLLPKQFPVPIANWDYHGGCMAVFNTPSPAYSYLLHPVGPKLNRLAVTPLEETSEGTVTIQAQMEKQNKILLKSGKIFQIAADSNIGACIVRNKKRYHYINLNNLAENDSFPMESFCLEEISDVKLSPYVAGEYLFATYSGILCLGNAEVRKELWKLEKPLVHDEVVQNMYWWCDFGAHPRSVLYSDRQRLCLLDLRSRHLEELNILSYPNPFLYEGEELAVTRRFASVHFQHIVATDNHLFICDERYPQQPVMSWAHMLKNVPLYCDIKQVNCDNTPEHIILLASQESAEIASFHVDAISRVQPLSFSLPRHLSKPSDCAKVSHFPCKLTEDKIVERLNLPLTGVCCVPHSCNTGYTVLQTNSYGDVFHQTFCQSSFQSIVTCNNVSSVIFPDLPIWTKCVMVKKQKKKKREKYVSLKISKRKILNSISKCVPSSKCLICNSRGIAEQSCDTNVCPRCGLHVEFQKSLLTCAENRGVLCGKLKYDDEEPRSPDIPMIDVSKYTDPCSQMILSAWEDAEASDVSEAKLSLSMFGDSMTPSLPINQSDSQIIRNIPFAASQESYFDEDIIPPTQEMSSQALYSRKKSRSNVTFAATVGF